MLEQFLLCQLNFFLLGVVLCDLSCQVLNSREASKLRVINRKHNSATTGFRATRFNYEFNCTLSRASVLAPQSESRHLLLHRRNCNTATEGFSSRCSTAAKSRPRRFVKAAASLRSRRRFSCFESASLSRVIDSWFLSLFRLLVWLFLANSNAAKLSCPPVLSYALLTRMRCVNAVSHERKLLHHALHGISNELRPFNARRNEARGRKLRQSFSASKRSTEKLIPIGPTAPDMNCIA